MNDLCESSYQLEEGLYKIDQGQILGRFKSVNDDGTVLIEHNGDMVSYPISRLTYVSKSELLQMLIENEKHLYNSNKANGYERDLKEWYYNHSQTDKLLLPELEEYLAPFIKRYSEMDYQVLLQTHNDLCTGLYHL